MSSVNERWRCPRFFFVWFVWIIVVFTAPTLSEEYCLTESFHAQCPRGEVVVMETARFGRMRLGRCVTRNYGNIGCSTEVLGLLDYACSGLSSCDFSVSDQSLVRTKPCPKDFASYLEATYHCVPALQVTSKACASTQSSLPSPFPSLSSSFSPTAFSVLAPEGYISSPGSNPSSEPRSPTTCFVSFRLRPGQRLNLTLYDFSFSSSSSSSSSSPSSSNSHMPSRNRSEVPHPNEGSPSISLPSPGPVKPCHRYAVVIEPPPAGEAASVCAGNQRLSHVYTSRSNHVQLEILASAPPSPHMTTAAHVARFLLRFEVIGCPDPVHSDDVIVTYEENRMTVMCNSSGETSFLICSGRRWIGYLPNCTTTDYNNHHAKSATVLPADLDNDDHFGNFSSLSQVGISMVITFGVALLVVVYVSGMAVCAMYIRNRRRRYKTATETTEQTTSFLEREDSCRLANLFSRRRGHNHGLTQNNGGRHVENADPHEVFCLHHHDAYIYGGCHGRHFGCLREGRSLIGVENTRNNRDGAHNVRVFESLGVPGRIEKPSDGWGQEVDNKWGNRHEQDEIKPDWVCLDTALIGCPHGDIHCKSGDRFVGRTTASNGSFGRIVENDGEERLIECLHLSCGYPKTESEVGLDFWKDCATQQEGIEAFDSSPTKNNSPSVLVIESSLNQDEGSGCSDLSHAEEKKTKSDLASPRPTVSDLDENVDRTGPDVVCPWIVSTGSPLL